MVLVISVGSWMISLNLKQDILVESVTVDEIVAEWNGNITNWAFILFSYMYLTIWVLSVRYLRPKKPQGRVVMIRQ